MAEVDFTIHLDGIDYTNNQAQLIKDIFFKYGKQHFDQQRFRTKIQAFKQNYSRMKKQMSMAVIPNWGTDIRDWNFMFQPSTCLKNTVNHHRYRYLLNVYPWMQEEYQQINCMMAIRELIGDLVVRLGAQYTTKNGQTKSVSYLKSWLWKILKSHLDIKIINIEYNN